MEEVTKQEAETIVPLINRIGDETCDFCGALDECLQMSETVAACESCITKAFKHYWNEELP